MSFSPASYKVLFEEERACRAQLQGDATNGVNIPSYTILVYFCDVPLPKSIHDCEVPTNGDDLLAVLMSRETKGAVCRGYVDEFCDPAPILSSLKGLSLMTPPIIRGGFSRYIGECLPRPDTFNTSFLTRLCKQRSRLKPGGNGPHTTS